MFYITDKSSEVQSTWLNMEQDSGILSFVCTQLNVVILNLNHFSAFIFFLVTVKLPSNFTWIKLNAGQNGFYRVNYLADHWKALGTALSNDHTVYSTQFTTFSNPSIWVSIYVYLFQVLTAADRWGVVDDVFSLAAAGSLSYSTALDTVKYIKKDRHPVPWVSALDKLASISNLLYSTNLYPGFRVCGMICLLFWVSWLIFFFNFWSFSRNSSSR